jgi:phospholipid transport system substrate-binding protein
VFKRDLDMIAKKNLNPVQRILAWLNKGLEIENYATHEIEALPIDEVRQRLEKLGVDSSLPGYIKNFTGNYASPAHKVLEALDDEIEELSPAELEHLAPGDVSVKLNSLGLNYRAGINKIRELTEARSDHEQRQNRPLKSRLDGIWARLRIAGAVAALARVLEPISRAKMASVAAAATAPLVLVFVISTWKLVDYKKAQFELDQTGLRQQIARLLKPDRQWSSGGATASERQAVTPSRGAEDGVRSFYNVLLGTMKDRTLGESDRYQRLASIVERTFDLPFMAQLVVGQSVWAGLPPAHQQKVTEALGQYIAATCAGNFASYSGEELRVVGERPHGEDVIVQTKIIQSNGETDFIDYLMRHSQGSWKISDAYLDGTVSELAKLRSEIFVPPARGGGRSDQRVESLPAASRFHRDRSGAPVDQAP